MELTNEFAKAVLCAYIALVNRLATSGAVNKDELISTLSGFSKLLIEGGHSQESAQYLMAFVASLSGEPSAVQDAFRILH